MKRVMVRYKVKPECAAENEQYIRKMFKALEREKPTGLRYASFKLSDGVSFVHIAMHEATNSGNPLSALQEFKGFTAGIKERCDELPVSAELTEVGSYNGFGE
jgi:hypothetical protein